MVFIEELMVCSFNCTCTCQGGPLMENDRADQSPGVVFYCENTTNPFTGPNSCALPGILRQQISCQRKWFHLWSVWWSVIRELKTLWKTKTFVQRVWPAGVVTPCVKWETQPWVSAFTSLNVFLHWPDRLMWGKCHGRWWHQWAVMLRVKVFGHMHLTRLHTFVQAQKTQRKGKCGPSCN